MLKNDKIKVYKVDFDSIVTAISLVQFPAIEENFVCLSKEEKKEQIVLSKTDKQMLYGAALVPDKYIYRYNQFDGEYYITFPKETIEKLAHDFISKGRVNSFSTEHKDETNDVTIIESWIKTSENDKSVDLGLELPIGSWVIGAKVHNKQLWEQIKSGEFQGFSIESYLGLDEIELKKENKRENMQTIEVNDNFFTKLFDAIKNALTEPEVPELEANVTAATVVDDIKEEVVVEEPVVEEEPSAILEEEIPTVVEEENPIAEEIADEVVEEVVEEEPTQEEATDTLQEVINELNQKIDELNAEIDALRKENQKLSKQPSTKPVSTRMSNNDNQSNFDRMLAIMDGSAFRK